MGKMVIPKNSASIEEVMGAMQIYYDANDWLSNADYIQTYKTRIGIIGDDRDSSAYTKKTEIGAYYGFIEWEDINRTQSPRRITERGKRFLEHYNSGNMDAVHEDLMLSLEEVSFGRNNFACRSCDSDIEPPALFLRAMIDLRHLTNAEFAYLVYRMEYEGMHYTDTIKEIKGIRDSGSKVEIPEEARKFADPKPILIMERWGVLSSQSNGGIKETSISSEFFSKYKNRLKNLKIYNIDKDIIDSNSTNDDADANDTLSSKRCTFDTSFVAKYLNLIVYGTPGCGKSWHVKNELLKDYKVDNIIRTTFYQDYTNTDFIGQIMPIVTGEDVTYKFNPGPFTLALKKAIEVPNEPVALVIEELNRGNAPSIFGDIFQLLDRENGKSEYQITNVNIQKYLSDNIPDMEFNCIMLPANLSIIATMNTSDQNVFTLDTAFKRRWDFKKLKNRFKADHPYKGFFVPGMDNMTWEMFVNDINNFIEDSSDLQSEDKQLGVFFVSEDLLCEDVANVTDELKEKFAYKVLEYLWDDVAKFERDNWFNSNIKSLDKLVEEYVKSGIEVFKDGIFGKHTS